MCAKSSLKWINAAAFACMVLVNALAEIIPIAGITTGGISALYPSPITPAPVSFNIWIVIYLYLAVFILTQIFIKANDDATKEIGPWFMISCVANIAWVFAWHYRAMTLAFLLMSVLLVSLAFIESKLRRKQETAYHRWVIRAPFGLYFGWITVAAIANMSVWLSSIGFTGWGLPSQLWQTVILLAGGMILCVGVWKNRDIPYGLAGLWAYTGIMMRQFSMDTTGDSYFWSLASIFISLIAIVFTIMTIVFEHPVIKFPTMKYLKSTSASNEQK